VSIRFDGLSLAGRQGTREDHHGEHADPSDRA
jgi:hypothetical protein